MVFALNQSENHASYKGKMVKLSVVRVHGIKTLSEPCYLTSISLIVSDLVSCIYVLLFLTLGPPHKLFEHYQCYLTKFYNL